MKYWYHKIDEPQNNYAELRKSDNQSKLQESIYINSRNPKLISMDRKDGCLGTWDGRREGQITRMHEQVFRSVGCLDYFDFDSGFMVFAHVKLTKLQH